ncbi:hypothetical protein [Clostridium tertium]
MKKFIFTFMVLIFSVFTMGCERKSVDKLSFQGSSKSWEATINYDKDNKYKVNIKYDGIEKLPMDVKFTV